MRSDPGATSAALLASLTHLMASWASTSTQAAVADAAGVDMDPIDLPPLYMLGLRGPSRAGDLATAMHVTRPTMSKQLARLERAGLIERHVDETDGRVAVISLSPSGAAAHELLVGRGVEMLDEAIADWDDAEAARFAAQLGRFVDALSDRTDPSVHASVDGIMRPSQRPRNGGNT